ncbi:hypothetical protein [Croceibacterium mercuriale]|nr:hypothetical protein [Croceibacterium mercuriale]
MDRASHQRLITLSLAVLDRAAYGSAQKQADTEEVRLALSVLWCLLQDRPALLDYWHKAKNVSGHPWESCREPYYKIAAACRKEGWLAPI